MSAPTLCLHSYVPIQDCRALKPAVLAALRRSAARPRGVHGPWEAAIGRSGFFPPTMDVPPGASPPSDARPAPSSATGAGQDGSNGAESAPQQHHGAPGVSSAPDAPGSTAGSSGSSQVYAVPRVPAAASTQMPRPQAPTMTTIPMGSHATTSNAPRPPMPHTTLPNGVTSVARPYVPGAGAPAYPSSMGAGTTVRPSIPYTNGAPPRPTTSQAARPPAENTAPRKPKPSSHANRSKNVALSALTGGVIGLPSQDTPPPGFLTAGGGGRKVIPELVLPFPLPTHEAPPDQPSEPLEERYVDLLMQLRLSPGITANTHDAYAASLAPF